MKALILPYFKKNFKKILAGMIAMIVVDGLQLITPQIIKNAVDALAQGLGDRSVILEQCLIILGLGLAMSILRYFWRIWLMGSARELEMGLRDDLFRHALDLDPAFYDRVKTGDVMAHATSDINHVRMAFGFGLIVMVDTLLLGTATLGIMIYTHPKLTLLAMIPMPFLVYFTRKLGQKMHDFHKTAQESFSILTEMVRESFFGIRVIKVFNFEPFTAERVTDASRDYFKKNLKRAVVTALMKPLLGFFFNLSSLIIIFYGGYLAMADQISPGELVSFLQYLNILAWPIIAIGWMTNLFQRGMASLKRIAKLLQARPGIQRPGDGGASWKDPKGDVQFQNVTFDYGETRVLDGIDLAVTPGTRAGISGPPGSGKTSLIQLIPRLYEATAGQVLVDGTDVRDLDPDTLRSHIALMPQEPFLFSGTIRENLLMGRTLDKDIPQERLDQVIHTCDLTRTLDQMPQGLETLVGERGVTLSGGQKQRLALARTLITDKKIIILDDPVSQVDTQTAENIISRLGRANPESTFIIISHRLSALAPCDTIYILDQGKIQARGDHDHLISTNPFYRDAFKVQQFEEARGV